jgi:hypothetical protein
VSLKGSARLLSVQTSRMNIAHRSVVRENLTGSFVWSAVVILAVTAVIKLTAATGEGRILAQPDPLVAFFSNRQIMVLAALLEALVVSLILRERDRLRQAALVAWIGTGFLMYRAGLWWVGYEGACSCLGNVTRTIGLSPAMEDLGVKVLLGYLVLGSYSVVIWEVVGRWKQARHGLSTAT